MEHFDFLRNKISTKFSCKLIVFTVLLSSVSIFESTAQIAVDQANTTSEVEDMVEDVLLGSCVTVSNVNYIGPASAAGTFDASGTTFAMQNGILLTTGSANTAIGPDNDNDAGVNQGTGGDADLTVLATESTFDAVILEFDFVPQDDTLTFRYVFASEEYPEWVNSEFNDVFGFFMSGPGMSGPYTGGAANIALIPGTTTPVAINNVNNGYSATEPASGPCENCAYYEENGGGPDVQYDGYTTVLTAQAIVTPCETYHIRLAIADAGDHIYDSGVFLEAGSFSSGGGITVDFTNISIEEGCSDEYIVFSRVDLSNNSTGIAATYSIGGTATAGLDYDVFPTTVTIPPGQDTVMIPISVPLDFMVEGTETIIVYMDQPPCDCLAPGDATISVIDNDVPLDLSTTGETTICLGQSVSLTSNTTGSLPPYSGSWDNGAPAGDNVTVSPTVTTTYTYTVTDACGSQTESSAETITVIRPDFITNDQNQCLDGNSFSFTNTGATGGTVSHFWEFGDSNTSTNENPSHTYSSDGSYIVTHHVIFTASGCTASASGSMTVYPEPFITASVDQNVICAGGTDGALSSSVSGGTSGYSYSWSPGGLTTAAISGVGVGNYTVTVTDANGCTDSDNATVTQSDPIPPTITCPPTATLNTDAGFCTSSGSIGTPTSSDNCGVASTVVDNSGPYPVGTTTVTWTVTDVNGNTATCTQDVVVIDNENPSVTCPPTATLNTDAGLCTSSASIGTPTSSDNCGVASTTVDNLGPYPVGTTTVVWTVTDVNGNSATCSQNVVVIDNEDPVILGCPDDISITPTSSDCTPVVEWIAPTSTDNCGSTISGSHGSGDSFSVGTTTVTYTATDANGNSVTCSFDVVITPSPLDLTLSSSTFLCEYNLSCFGAEDGSATAAATGGCLPYSYLWSDGQTTSTATGLAAGTYSVTVTDVNGSQTTESITLSQPSLLDVTGVSTSEYQGENEVSCNGATDGSINITVSGGAECESYSYSWTGPNGFSSSSEDISDLAAGTYTVTVTDVNGCETTESITLDEPAGLVLDCQAEDALCNADANGSVSVGVSGGTGPYSYLWSNGATTSSQSGLTAGTYSVTVTDANGCTESCSATVSEPDALTATVDVQDETLVNGCNGFATANPTGGTPPYSYSWDNGQTTETAINLCAGIYVVTITDANGCVYTTSIVINPPSCDLEVDVTSTDVSCNQGSNGTVTATPLTDQNYTPFTYLWNNGATTATVSGLTAGPYSVVITDSIGCEASGSVVISEPTALSVATVVVDEQTFEGCDGSATVNPSGGTPGYTYLWSDGQTTQTASNLCPGTYTVVVTDTNGCTQTTTITVNPLLCTGFTVAVNTYDLSCFEAGDGAAITVVTGGTAPFTYSWDNGGTTDSISALSAGSYTVTVTDAVNCVQIVSGTITQPALLEAATAPDNVSCFGAENGAIELTVTGGTSPFTYNWDNGATTEDLNNLGPGTYNVDIEDANGCTTSASATITEPDTLGASSVDVNPTCFEGNDGTIDLSISGGLGPYLVSWNNGENTEDISGLSAGTYVATIVDQNGCVYTYSTTLSDPNLLVPIISADGPTIFCEGDSVTLTSSEAATYLWSPGGETTQSMVVHDPGNYTVSVVDENGCEGSSAPTSVSIHEVEPATIDVSGPTAFCEGDEVTLFASPGSAYVWMPNGETTASITVDEAGTYSVTVTDFNGCESTSDDVTITIFDEPVPTITADGPLAFCEGGSVTLTSSEWVTYSWLPNGETTQSIVVTESGFYSVNITDENGCEGRSALVEVTVYENPEPVITSDGNTEFCEGSFVVLSGPSGFIYDWSPNGENTQSISASESGDYQLTVTDELGCSGESNIISVTVFEVDTATITASGPTEFCDGGELILTSSEGASYSWSPNGETTQTINVTTSGTYTVTVIDENGCETTSDPVEVTVNPNPVPVITANGPTEFCEGDSVILTAPAGYIYNWSPNGETTQSITVSSTGTWSVAVTDENGCTGISDPVSTTVFEIDPVTITADGSTEFCDGDQVTLTASTGATFLWSPNGETTQSITVTESGNYTVSVVDENGCGYASADTIEVIVNPNPVPTITADGPTEFCDEGSVVLTSSEAEAYLWSPNGETTQSITVTASGTYAVTVTDENGCEGTSTGTVVTVFDLPEPTVTADGPISICEEDSVTLTSSLAEAYLWSPNGETTQSITVNQAGVYSVLVTDENGCQGESAPIVVSIFETEPVFVSADGPTTICEGDEVIISASSGSGFVWSPNGETTQSITVSESGEYSVEVTDQNGCSVDSDTITIEVLELPEVAITASGATALCPGDSVTLTSTEGIAYLWYEGGETTQSITVFEAGTYWVEMADSTTCVGTSDSIEVTVFEVVEVEVTADGSTIFCEGGEVTLTASTSQSYDWNPNGEQTQSITVTETGTYSVDVTDSNGCASSSAGIQVEAFELPEVSVSLMGPDTLCEGETVDLQAISVDPVTYQWLENGVPIIGEIDELLTVGDDALYAVFVTDTNGCTAEASAPVIAIGAIPVAVIIGDGWACPGDPITLIASGGENYLWNNGSTESSITIIPDTATQYVVTVSNAYCSTTSSDSATVGYYPVPTALIETNYDGILEVSHAIADISGDTSVVYWSWDFGDGMFGEDQNPDHTYSDEGLFDVVLTVENEYGCSAIDSAQVEITQIIDIPNVFTPNLDGYNDNFFFANFGVDTYELTIYNRWGIVVHYDNSGEIFWDGRSPAGAECKAGTYYYVLNVINEFSVGDFQKTGYITLIR